MDRDYDTLRDTLGQNVRRLRRARKLSQEELAFEAEIDRTYVSQIERGVISPSLHVRWRLGKAPDADVTILLQPSA